jgi:hypothetical protein
VPSQYLQYLADPVKCCDDFGVQPGMAFQGRTERSHLLHVTQRGDQDAMNYL